MADYPNRDFVLARMAVAVSRLTDARDMITTAVQQFAEDDLDDQEDQRGDLIDDAIMCCHEAVTALFLAKGRMAQMPKDELSVGEGVYEPEEDASGDDD